MIDKIVLLRHATSNKNLQDRHGGPGATLVKDAEFEIFELVTKFKNFRFNFSKIYCSEVPQTIGTAKLLSEHFSIPFVADERIRPLHLGVLDGLSNAEAKVKYPEVHYLMNKWREGEIELQELIIPEAEDYSSFYERGNRFLHHSLMSEINDVLVVGTRSILILLISLMLGRTINPDGGYKEIPIENSWFFTFELDDNKFIFLDSYSSCDSTYL